LIGSVFPPAMARRAPVFCTLFSCRNTEANQ
jgi:hypothetical protein